MRPVLRGYQIGGVDRTRDAFRRVHRVVLVMPTGAGKTVAAGSVIASAVEKGGRVLFLAHRKELIDQASAKLTQFGVDHGVIKAGVVADLGKAVQVASVQTLVRRLGALTGEPSAVDREIGFVPAHLMPFTLIVVDECHHVIASTYQQILGAWPHARVLGLTATPYRIDGAALGDCFEDLVIGATVPELIGGGHLVRTRTFAPPPPEALKAVHVRAGEFQAGEAAAVLDRIGPIQEITRTWEARAAGRLTVGFGCTVEHCEHLAEAFRARGHAAAAVDGTMGESERSDILGSLRAGVVRVVFNVALLTEGFDLPDLSCLIEARPTKSRCFWRQMCGRIVRPAPGKDDGLILDHAANGHRFGVPDAADHYSLQDEEKGTRARSSEPTQASACPACHRLLPVPAPDACPSCGKRLMERGRVAAPGRIEMEISELNPADEADRYRWYRRCVAMAVERNKKTGWVYYRYQERWADKPPVWMPVKAGIYEELFHRPPTRRLIEIARAKGNAVEVMA